MPLGRGRLATRHARFSRPILHRGAALLLPCAAAPLLPSSWRLPTLPLPPHGAAPLRRIDGGRAGVWGKRDDRVGWRERGAAAGGFILKEKGRRRVVSRLFLQYLPFSTSASGLLVRYP